MTQVADHGNRRFCQGADALDPELAGFATKFCGSLADPKLAREEVSRYLALHRDPSPAYADLRLLDRKVPGVEHGPAVPIRIYQPQGVARPTPALLYFHGGAFVLGSPDLDDPLCIAYARHTGYAVVSVDYRLAPEHPYPAAVEDGYSVLHWIAQCGSEERLDPTRIAVMGSSAGGALAAATALMARDQAGPAVQLQLLIYPVLDDRLETPSMLSFVDTPVFARHAAIEMWRHYRGAADQVPSYAAPARAGSLAGLPPTYIEACALDPLVDEALAYARKLRDAGVPVTLHLIEGAPHGFDQDYLGAPTTSSLASKMLRSRVAALRAAGRPP